MIKVIKGFYDLQDGCHQYKVGDTYPRKDYKPTKVRIDELAGNKNKLGFAVIEKEETKPKKKSKE